MNNYFSKQLLNHVYGQAPLFFNQNNNRVLNYQLQRIREIKQMYSYYLYASLYLPKLSIAARKSSPFSANESAFNSTIFLPSE